MPKALSVFWSSLGTFYSELFTFAGMNLLWFVLSIPIAAVVFLVLAFASSLFPFLSFLANVTQMGPLLLWFVFFFLLVSPNPVSAGIYYFANQAARHQLLEFAYFWAGLRRYFAKSAILFAISTVGMLAVLFNLSFYVSVPNDYIRLLGILFLYLLYFWLSMQLYVLPLVIEYPQRSVLTILKNAALIALDNPGFTFLVFLMLLIWSALCLVLSPLVPLASVAVAGVVQNKALLSRLEKYGLYQEEQ